MLQLEDLQYADFIILTLNFDSDLWKIKDEIWHSCAKCRENRTYTYWEIATSIKNERTNEQTNKQTRLITIPPGGDNYDRVTD